MKSLKIASIMLTATVTLTACGATGTPTTTIPKTGRILEITPKVLSDGKVEVRIETDGAASTEVSLGNQKKTLQQEDGTLIFDAFASGEKAKLKAESRLPGVTTVADTEELAEVTVMAAKPKVNPSDPKVDGMSVRLSATAENASQIEISIDGISGKQYPSSGSEALFASLEAGKSYTARFIAVKDGVRSEEVTRSFTIGAVKPSVPALTTPKVDGTTVKTTGVTPGDKGTLEVSIDGLSGSTQYPAPGQEITFTSAHGLEANKSYTMRAVTVDNGLKSDPALVPFTTASGSSGCTTNCGGTGGNHGLTYTIGSDRNFSFVPDAPVLQGKNSSGDLVLRVLLSNNVTASQVSGYLAGNRVAKDVQTLSGGQKYVEFSFQPNLIYNNLELYAGNSSSAPFMIRLDVDTRGFSTADLKSDSNADFTRGNGGATK